MEQRASELAANGKPVVGILTGSPNDLPVVKKAQETLSALGIPSELFVLSAHRTPDLTARYCKEAEQRGLEVIIACAGMAAHLAGAVAAQTLLPVIGVPLKASLDGLDALLATVQMPPGVPVATVGIDNAKNAAYLAARMLARKFPEVKARLEADLREQQTRYDDPFKS
jgi:5-(carboxyamino)imidazole ribonucleotide mutase